MLILMTRLWIRSKALYFSHVTACGFGPVGPCNTYDALARGVQGYWQNRITGQRWTGRQANGRRLCSSESSGGNNYTILRRNECQGRHHRLCSQSLLNVVQIRNGSTETYLLLCN